MWRSTTIPLAIGLALANQHLCFAQDATNTSDLILRSQWVQFDIVSGRITAYHAQLNQSKTASINEPDKRIQESYTVSNEQGNPAVSFQRTDPKQHLTIEFVGGNQLEIRREPRGDANDPVGHFFQPKNGPLTLTISQGESYREYRGESFWHLMLAESDVCREHLVPILETLRPDWRLMDAVDRLRQTLIEVYSAAELVPRSHVHQFVQQLSSDTFKQRQAADRELRQLGQAAVGYLDRLDRQTLNAEQRLRIRKIHASLATQVEDTPQRAAARLVSDPSIWLILMEDDEFTTRRAAADRLARISGKPLTFNPGARLEERTAQIERVCDLLKLDEH